MGIIFFSSKGVNMSTALPQVLYEIIDMIASFIRLLGMAALGVGLGYLAVDLLRKVESWPMQAVGFLGLAGLVIAMVVFLSPGALGAFGIGVGVAIFVWGIPKKKKEDQETTSL
jgi:predicted permease